MESSTTRSRKINCIEYSNQTRQAYINQKRGEQQQTAALNINLKNSNKNFLQQYLNTVSSSQEAAIINTYIQKDKPNFGSTRKLYGGEKNQDRAKHQKIKKYMLDIYSGSQFLEHVFSNENTNFKAKLIFIKYMQKIRKSAIHPEKHTAWKDKY